MQLALYKYLCEKKNKCYKYYIYNILNNEMYELTSSHHNLQEMVEKLLFNRMYPQQVRNDEEFIKECHKFNHGHNYL